LAKGVEKGVIFVKFIDVSETFAEPFPLNFRGIFAEKQQRSDKFKLLLMVNMELILAKVNNSTNENSSINYNYKPKQKPV